MRAILGISRKLSCLFLIALASYPTAMCAQIQSTRSAALLQTTRVRSLHQKNQQKARVQFLATSTLVRGNWGPNEDTYLAELTFKAGGEPLLVRLVDTYPSFAPPLSRSSLIAPSGTTLKVRRDAECDHAYGQIILRTAPGDPMAILPERFGFHPQLERLPGPNEVLPCYRVMR